MRSVGFAHAGINIHPIIGTAFVAVCAAAAGSLLCSMQALGIPSESPRAIILVGDDDIPASPEFVQAVVDHLNELFQTNV